MEKERIQFLLARLDSGMTTEAERHEIEQLLEAGLIDLRDMPTLSRLDTQIMDMDSPAPSPSLDQNFYAMLGKEKTHRASSGWPRFFSWPEFAPKFAIASATLIIGLVAGYLFRSPASATDDQRIMALSHQVSELQEMMMLSLLERGSATDRLKAVHLTQEMSDASRKVTNALIQTLNQDENVNVRLAALDALKPYATDSSVREALIHSITKQESPLVQISLAELMVALQERSAVKEFEKIVESEKIPEEVRKRIRKSIDVLI